MALVGIVVAVSWSSPSLRSSSPCCLWCMYMLSTPQHRKTRVYTSVRCTRNLSAQTWLTSPHCGSKPYRVLITGFLGESLFYATLSECGFLDVHFLLFCLLLSLASLCWCSLACMQVCCPYFLNFVNEQTNLWTIWCSSPSFAKSVMHDALSLPCVTQNPGDMLLAPRISCGHFFSWFSFASRMTD